MKVAAHLKQIRLSAQKARLVADQVRGLSVEKALDELTFSKQKAAKYIYQVIKSAMSNAENNEGADIDELRVETIYVNQGPVLKRFQPRAKGRGNRILKPTCHVSVVVSDERRN